MGYIALVFVLCLAIVCLRKDCKVERNVSFAIWLPVLWMMRVASRSFAYWGGEWADPIILFAMTVLAIIALRPRAEKLRRLCAGNRFLFIFFVYLTISVLWSSDIPVTFKRWVRAVGDLSMALIVLTERNPFVALLCVLRRMVVVLIPLSLVLSMYFPDIGLGGYDAWVGVTVDKNLLGLLCFVASAYLLWHWMMRRRKSEWTKNMRVAGIPFEIPFLALSIYLLIGGNTGSVSRSSTAIVLLALAIGGFCLIEYARNRRLRLASVITPLIILLLFVQVLPRVFGFRSLSGRIIEDVLHKNVNLTDRAAFWPLLLKKGMMHPWLGSGFASFFTPQMEAEIEMELAKHETYFKPNQAHNGYLEVFLNLGVTGLALLMLVIYSSFRNLARLLGEPGSEYARIRSILLVCILVSNWTEASFARPTEFIWFLFLLVAINPLSHAMQVSARAAKQATVAEKPHVWEPVPTAGHANATTLRFSN